MKNATLILAIFIFGTLKAFAQTNDTKMEWWKESKFGMFIHWGLYSVPAGIYNGTETDQTGEWIMFNESIPVPEYENFAYEFNPIKFNASEWVGFAKKAGMQYIVITRKHHDVFNLWNLKMSDYDIIEKT